MDANFYRFRAVWTLQAQRQRVLTLLADPGTWPRWWPQIRTVQRAGPQAVTVRIRAPLPYSIAVTVHRTRQDPDAGVLEATLTGELHGWARWTLDTPDSDLTRVTLQQEVVVRRRLLRRLSPLCRPLLRLNHAAMIRAGQRGLRKHLRQH